MKYRKKSAEVDAVQWFGPGDHPDIAQYHPDIPGQCTFCHRSYTMHGTLKPAGLDRIYICPGDWIITEPDGTVFTRQPGFFAEHYEPAK